MLGCLSISKGAKDLRMKVSATGWGVLMVPQSNPGGKGTHSPSLLSTPQPDLLQTPGTNLPQTRARPAAPILQSITPLQVMTRDPGEPRGSSCTLGSHTLPKAPRSTFPPIQGKYLLGARSCAWASSAANVSECRQDRN